jgi:hypothetical protein
MAETSAEFQRQERPLSANIPQCGIKFRNIDEKPVRFYRTV